LCDQFLATLMSTWLCFYQHLDHITPLVNRLPFSSPDRTLPINHLFIYSFSSRFQGLYPLWSMPFRMWFKWYKHEKYFDLFTPLYPHTRQANSWGDAILELPPSVSYSNDTLWTAFNTKRNCRWHFKSVREKQSPNFQSWKRVRWEFSCVTCKGSHNYKIFTLSSLIPSFSEELELQKLSSEEYQIQGLLTWPWVVSQLKLIFFYRNMSTYSLKLPEVNISVMKFTFFVLVSTHELCNLMMFLCFSVFNKWTSD
jgi:hypothetical protein